MLKVSAGEEGAAAKASSIGNGPRSKKTSEPEPAQADADELDAPSGDEAEEADEPKHFADRRSRYERKSAKLPRIG